MDRQVESGERELLARDQVELREGLEHDVLFFFQAEDGIRDLTVTGVQTCALPIYRGAALRLVARPCQLLRRADVGLDARQELPHAERLGDEVRRPQAQRLDGRFFRRQDRKSVV